MFGTAIPRSAFERRIAAATDPAVLERTRAQLQRMNAPEDDPLFATLDARAAEIAAEETPP